MSDTPRTDALEITCGRDCGFVLQELARQLERELAEARVSREELLGSKESVLHWAIRAEKAEAENAALKADAERWRLTRRVLMPQIIGALWPVEEKGMPAMTPSNADAAVDFLITEVAKEK